MRKRTKSYSAINVKSDSMAVTGCNLVKKKSLGWNSQNSLVRRIVPVGKREWRHP